jgi:hypothetical protein
MKSNPLQSETIQRSNILNAVRNIIIKLIFNLVKSASEEISVLFSSANAFHLLEKEGVLKARGASSKEYD